MPGCSNIYFDLFKIHMEGGGERRQVVNNYIEGLNYNDR